MNKSAKRCGVDLLDGSRLPLINNEYSNPRNRRDHHLPMALLKAKAFLKPVTAMTTSLLSKTVATPTVKAMRGTAEMSLLKNRALARIVSYARVLILVLEASEEPAKLRFAQMWMNGISEPGSCAWNEDQCLDHVVE